MLEAETSYFTFACVVVTAPIGRHEELTYAIPEAFQTSLGPGVRVLVPVGRRKMTGMVTRVSTSHDLADKNLKYILDVLDETPIFSEEMMELWQWTANYYLASLGDMLSTMLPGGLRSESTRMVMGVKKSKVKSADSTDTSDVQWSAPELTGGEKRILDFVLAKKRVTTKTLGQRFPSLPIGRIVQSLEAQNLLTVREHLPQTRLPKPEASSVLAGAETSAPPFRLSAEQEDAYSQITAALKLATFRVFLLHGVTGSGKTEVYVRAAQAVVHSGKRVLMLVPEIGLTHQLVERARQHFGSRVAVVHSGMRPSQRRAEWQRIARGEAPVIIGARSAIFAPVSQLGLIVVDEEHDGAYKQEEGVRYNARDLAVVRGRISSCPVVLGSATPSLESYLHSQSRRYTLLSLPQRIASRPLPEVEVVDLRRQGRPKQEAQPRGPDRIFSAPLQHALVENHQGGRQSLLFMNRRGYANYLQCHQCGEVLVCPQCSVTLTWHRTDHALRCHYCGFSKPPPERCPTCSSSSLRDSGVGTQQVEEALTQLMPSARIGRLDRDTVRRRGALDRILGAWRAGELDVLIGTQMIAKGHDVPGVTLVGVLLADISLNLPDFRAAERTFQLLAQVAGRAGRGDDPGRVIIQTYSPDHYSIRAALKHDFARFATQELGYRKQLDYPPFTRAVNIRFESADSEKVTACAERFAQRLQVLIQEEDHARGSSGSKVDNDDHLDKKRSSPTFAVVLGPAPAPIEKIKGRARWQLLLKGEHPRALHGLIQRVRQELGQEFGLGKTRGGREMRTIVDVDPYSML